MKIGQELLKVSFDIQFSGTTLVSTYIKGKQLWCANVGDSRAVLSRNGNPVPLNRDHKPDLADEAERILRN